MDYITPAPAAEASIAPAPAAEASLDPPPAAEPGYSLLRDLPLRLYHLYAK
jgi:hypothetical protein